MTSSAKALEDYRKFALKAALELGYGMDIYYRVEAATSAIQIDQIMRARAKKISWSEPKRKRRL